MPWTALVPLAIVLAAGHLLVLPPRTGSAPGATAVWAVRPAAAAAAVPNDSAAGDLLAFRTGSLFGYVTDSGQIRFREPVLFDVAYSDQMFVNYSRVSATLAVRDTEGRLLTGIRDAGYPLLPPGSSRVLVVGRSGTSLASYRATGERVWHYELAAPAACLATGGDATLIGLTNGVLVLLDDAGRQVAHFAPRSEGPAVTVGCALHHSGLAAAIIGLRPQRLYIVDLQPGAAADRPSGAAPAPAASGPSIRHVSDIPAEFRFEVPLAISADGAFVYYPTGAGLHVLDLRSRRAVPIAPLQPRLLSAGEDGMLLAVGERDGAGQLLWTTRDGRPLLRTEVPLRSWVRRLDRTVLVGFDRALVRVDIERR